MGGRDTRERIIGTTLEVRGVVEKGPDIVEVVIRTCRTGGLIQVIQPCDFSTKLKRMVADYFGCYILIGVGPLIEDARSSGTEGNQLAGGDAAYLVDLRLR